MAIDKKDLAEFKKLIAGGATLEDLTTVWAEAEAEIRKEKRMEEMKIAARKELADATMNYLEMLEIITPETSDEEYDLARDTILESLKEWENWLPRVSVKFSKSKDYRDEVDKLLSKLGWI